MTGATLTWQRLQALTCAEFEAAGDGWHEISARADSDRARVDRAMTAKLRETQESDSAAAAIKRLERLGRNFQYVHAEAGLIRTALNGLAAELAGPQKQLTQALEDAESLKFTVHADGSVSYPAAVGETLLGKQDHPGGSVQGSARLPLEAPGLGERPGLPGGQFNPNPNAAKAEAIADLIARAVRSATEIDDRYAKVLNKLKAAKGLDVTKATLADVFQDTASVRSTASTYLAQGVPWDESPAVRKEWWDGLTDERQQEYLEVAPELVGGLDGIPAVARDEANRNYLPVLINKLEGQDGNDARTKLDALRGIEGKLSEPSKVPMFLLGVGDEGNGRAIVAYGNPDTSRNVSAYVPGLGTKLDEEFVDGTLKRGLDTAKGARMHDPSSSAIVWLGYDAPNLVTVGMTGNAEAGAPAFNQFMDGLGATNRHDDPHVTAIGHSYGSLTVGTAARQDGGIPAVDDIILLGSPGVGVDKAEDLGVGKENVYVGAADNDPVTQLPSKQQSVVGVMAVGAGPLISYVAGDVADSGDDDVHFGKDPASAAFGARRFEVDEGPHPILEAGGFDAHSQYFTPEKDQVSANNIALIVAGQPERIKAEEWR
ncbi:alpha/beta hydrolase family protein [Streptomyces sp. NBC_01102]|uniref:alpha/beta hydrolase n=1 Tax=unclassified Streptomyces TaxID=2593676 RepID=UPI00386D1EFA|nr:alpha/beta hydrolase family protein [Streptomyces sp. NBC_01102]